MPWSMHTRGGGSEPGRGRIDGRVRRCDDGERHEEVCEVAQQGGEMAGESVDHPPHYNTHSSGIECIDVAEGFNFNIGNAVKYLWRAGLKGEALEDLEKACWYVRREVERVKKNRGDWESPLAVHPRN